MALYSFETVTIMTVAAIGIILAIYLAVLKRNGWLGAGSKCYLCPNQECKRVFQKPVELKDLSVTPTRVYRACPHCGFDLEKVLDSCVEKKSKPTAKTSFEPRTNDKIDHSLTVLKDYLDTGSNSPKESHVFVNQVREDPVKIETGEPKTAEPAPDSPKKPSKPESEINLPEQVHTSQAKKPEMTPTQKQRAEAVTVFPSSPGCQYGYGYLSQRRKGEEIPAMCLECPKSLDCMLSEQCMHCKKEESVKEIKKWYSP